jgi:hypothetical protein
MAFDDGRYPNFPRTSSLTQSARSDQSKENFNSIGSGGYNAMSVEGPAHVSVQEVQLLMERTARCKPKPETLNPR